MWEISPQHLQEAMDLAGITQSRLAEIVGLKQPSIGRLLSGETKTTRALFQIAEALGTSPEFLKGEAGGLGSGALQDRRLSFRGADREFREDEVLIEQIDVRFGMGGTFIESHVERTKRAFPREWVRLLTPAPMAQLVWTSGVGDSMEPTIRDGDPLLADLGQDRLIEHDAIWICMLGEIGMIKRLRPHPDGSIEILSDNPSVPPMRATDGELHIIGRVLGRWGRL